MVHGALWQAFKSEGDFHQRCKICAARIWVFLLIAAVIFLIATAFATGVYDNYLKYPILFLIPLTTVAGLVLTRIFISNEGFFKAWCASSVTIVGATLFGVIGIYPSLLPSSLDPTYSLTIHTSASSPLTLKIMLVVALIFVPVVIGYQIWVYRLFRDKVTVDDLSYDEGY